MDDEVVETIGRPFVVALSNGEIMTLLMACGHMLAGNPPGNIPELLRSAAAQLARACDPSAIASAFGGE
jgi:hypothetical protein